MLRGKLLSGKVLVVFKKSSGEVQKCWFCLVSLDLMFTSFFFPLCDAPAEGSAPLLLSH